MVQTGLKFQGVIMLLKLLITLLLLTNIACASSVDVFENDSVDTLSVRKEFNLEF